MRLAKTFADLHSDLDSGADAERVEPVENPSHALAFDEFHGDEGDAVGAVEIVDTAHILVRNLAREPQFILESVDERRLLRNLRFQNLERNDLPSFAVASLVNETHPAHSKPRENFVSVQVRGSELLCGCISGEQCGLDL